ncbi:hypothetical protein EYF80_036000 [Liparis tanakae]|uniref:Uncharacterized protein n=1 Tax=Liparis tanakae TaxID=230148 RepID=A0A4Z2GK05_9TELE|nr:hypothetical protein EYF80_036000 [Liparis tanakae]
MEDYYQVKPQEGNRLRDSKPLFRPSVKVTDASSSHPELTCRAILSAVITLLYGDSLRYTNTDHRQLD